MSNRHASPSKLRSTVDQYEFNIALYKTGENPANFLHYHDYYEFVIYLGAVPVMYHVSGQDYTISFGDVIVCDLFDEHMLLCAQNDQHRRFSVGISPNFVLSCSAGTDNLLQIFNRNSKSYPIMHIGSFEMHKYLDLIEVLQSRTLKHGQIIYEKAILHQFLALLYEDFFHTNNGIMISTRKDSLVRELIDYINLHLSEELSLEALSNATNYNAAYLCRIFKDITNNTLSRYITEKRINTAILMMGDGRSLSEISLEVGFRNYSSFYKAFKKITGIGPEDYHRTH
ncbi:MAG: AraC family transcriptional regulator [Oscillospiraceae bacterium]